MKIIKNEHLTIIDDLFTERELERMDAWFASYTHWGLGYDMQDYGASSATLCRSLKWDMWVGYHAILDDIQNLMRERIEAETDIKVPYFQRCLINNFKFGDSPMFHKDSPTNDDSRTFMVYPNKVWDLNWGGYTAFADEDDNVVACANPKPGRVVIFRGNLNHCGVAPTKVHKGYGRYSIAYQDPEQTYDKSLLKASNQADINKISQPELYPDFHRLIVNE